jgi:hypothetical protein
LQKANAGNAEIERILSKCLAYLGIALSWESRQPKPKPQ